jgi:dTDP-4-amino-4,6-dideoxy-D-glucose acyltransferase
MQSYNGEFMGRAEVEALGVGCSGEDIRVHRSVVIIAPERLGLGNHVRIDPFSILSATGGITMGDHIHIASHCTLIGGGGITLDDFSGVSHGARLLSASDDFDGSCLTGPTVPDELRNVASGLIHVGAHAVIGSGAVVLPGITLGDGAIVGALSLVRSDVPAFEIWGGIPARYIRARRQDLLQRTPETRPPPQ